MTNELDSLVPGIVHRDNRAFARLYDLLADRLGAFAFSLVGDRQMAEDAVQQAFFELAKAAPDLRGDGRSLQAWMYKSVRFTCLDEYRRRSRRPEIPIEVIPDVALVDENSSYDVELATAIQSLSERQQLLLSLRHVHGLSGEEIADVVELGRPAAYAAIGRAEKSLRKAFYESVESRSDAASMKVEGGDIR